MTSTIATRLLTILTFVLVALTPRGASALIEGTDRQRVNLRDDGTSATITWSPGLDRRADGIYVPAKSGDNWVDLPKLAIGKDTRPAREAVVTADIAVDGIDVNEFWVFVRYSADGKKWSTWIHMPIKARQRGILSFKSELRVPLASRSEYENRMNEWIAGGGNPREEQHLYVRWLQRRDPKFFENQIPFIRHIQVRIEVEKPRNLGLLRQVDIETHWTARIDGD